MQTLKLKKNSFNFITIDILRAIAASLVFLYHYGFFIMIKKIFGTNIFDIIALLSSGYAVSLFFLISGFCIHLSQLKQNNITGNHSFLFSSYFKRRFWRIYPTYLIVLLFATTVSALNGEKVSLIDFFVHVFVCQGFSVQYFNTINVVLWTITIEILFYILYPFWYLFRQKYGLNFALFLSILISIFSWIIIISFFDYSIFPLKYFVLNLWGSWCFGAWLCEQLVIKKTEFIKNFWWWIFGGILFFLFFWIRHFYWSYIICFSISICLWAWFVVPIIYLEKKLQNVHGYFGKRVIEMFVAIGISSYSLYMLHEPLMYLRNSLFAKLNSEFLKLIFGLIWLVFTYVLAWINYQIFEMPFLKFRSNNK